MVPIEFFICKFYCSLQIFINAIFTVYDYNFLCQKSICPCVQWSLSLIYVDYLLMIHLTYVPSLMKILIFLFQLLTPNNDWETQLWCWPNHLPCLQQGSPWAGHVPQWQWCEDLQHVWWQVEPEWSADRAWSAGHRHWLGSQVQCHCNMRCCKIACSLALSYSNNMRLAISYSNVSI